MLTIKVTLTYVSETRLSSSRSVGRETIGNLPRILSCQLLPAERRYTLQVWHQLCHHLEDLSSCLDLTWVDRNVKAIKVSQARESGLRHHSWATIKMTSSSRLKNFHLLHYAASWVVVHRHTYLTTSASYATSLSVSHWLSSYISEQPACPSRSSFSYPSYVNVNPYSRALRAKDFSKKLGIPFCFFSSFRPISW